MNMAKLALLTGALSIGGVAMANTAVNHAAIKTAQLLR